MKIIGYVCDACGFEDHTIEGMKTLLVKTITVHLASEVRKLDCCPKCTRIIEDLQRQQGVRMAQLLRERGMRV